MAAFNDNVIICASFNQFHINGSKKKISKRKNSDSNELLTSGRNSQFLSLFLVKSKIIKKNGERRKQENNSQNLANY